MFQMEEIFLSTKDSNECFLMAACGKELSGEDVYLAPNSANWKRNSELSSNNKMKLGVLMRRGLRVTLLEETFYKLTRMNVFPMVQNVFGLVFA